MLQHGPTRVEVKTETDTLAHAAAKSFFVAEPGGQTMGLLEKSMRSINIKVYT
jgi:hypothetical protein